MDPTGGTLDLQAPPGPKFPAIEATLNDAQNRDVALREMPGLNHALQSAVTHAGNQRGPTAAFAFVDEAS